MNSKLLLLFIAVAVFGQNCTNPLNVGTFNTQLILTAPFRQERLQAQIQYFQTNAQNLEILCLQEIWDPSFRQQYVSSLQSVFPNAFYPANFPLNNSQCTRSCAEGTLASLSGCLSGAGCFANNNNQASCALNNCRNIFNGLDNTCSACIASSLNLDLNDRINQCSNDGVSASQCVRFFNGYTDPLILSKYPFLATDHLLFSNSPLTETTVLYARVNTTELGPVNVFCTHLLPANFQIVDFSSVNRDQTQQMLSYVQSKVIGMEPIVLMGDFNFGPAISSNIEASWPQNYQLVSDSGFVSSFLAANPNPTCTYCTQNPLNIGTNSYVIDHIFVKNASIVNSTLFATNAQVQAGGRQVPLSDHYGVAASLCPGVPSTVPTFGATPVTGTQSTGVIISIPGVINNQVGASSIVSVSFLLVALCYLFTVIF